MLRRQKGFKRRGAACAVRLTVLFNLLSLVFTPVASSTEPVSAELGPWKLEQLVLVGGVTYRGLVQVEREREIDFVEIDHPTGGKTNVCGCPRIAQR